jgi:predicted ATPase
MLSLRRLDEREATELVEKVAGDSILSHKIVAQIVAHTDGIPLFVEELT